MAPSTVPWGTPDKTEVQDEWCPRRTTRWYRLVRKLLSQDRSGPWIPYACIFVKRRSCGTESNAFDMVNFTRKLQKQITGGHVGGFLIPQNYKINQLIAYKHLLSAKQKQDILNAVEKGSGVHIRPTKTQMDRGLGTILATIGLPIAMELVKK